MPPQQNYRIHDDNDTTYFPATKSGTRNDIRKSVEAGACNINEIGLENFIRNIVEVLDLNLGENVVFNLNDRGIIHKWSDVFAIERTYSACLGISERFYTCHGYVHKIQQHYGYFVLEEFNKRTVSFLPAFKFYVYVCCYYDHKTRTVTKVDVQYDQMSFFLHALGLQNVWRWVVSNLLTPLAMVWMAAFRATGMVNPFTFLAQILLVLVLIYWEFW
mmetsp:Transcript_17028/g.25774  ORF Transcript_17028/g.25774 Transcript_17028/m.25774 type:complete len:217 (-) Transcript_17028:71-721(-)